MPPAPFIATCGEALIDWVCLDRSLELSGAETFVKAIGGAPANVSVGLSRLGCPVQFVGGFSTDFFGDWLQTTLTDEGVGLNGSKVLPDTNTRQAYVLTDDNGNRVLKGFTQAACADVALKADDLDPAMLNQAAIVYWGSVVQSAEPTATALTGWLSQLPDTVLKVYDPNYRAVLWPTVEAACAVMRASFDLAHVVKLSDDEIVLFDNSGASFETIGRRLIDTHHIDLLIVTLGAQGSLYITAQTSARVLAFSVASVEMTGAGDGFVAGVLAAFYERLVQSGVSRDPQAFLQSLTANELAQILRSASAVGALATTRPGAMTSLPTRAELDAFLAENAPVGMSV